MRRHFIPAATYRLLLAGIATLAISCNLSAQEARAELTPVIQRALGRSNLIPGELRAWEAVDLHARVSGFVEEVLVDRGAGVSEGQVLVRMSAPELAARRAEAQSRIPAAAAQRIGAEAQLAAVESTFARLQEAARTPGVVAENEVVLAGKAVETARAQVEAAKKSVESIESSVAAIRALEDFLTVKAPFAGIVTERIAHPGTLAGPEGEAGRPLLRLEQVRRLRLVVAVPEAFSRSIRIGARLSFTVAAFPGRAFPGVVARPSYSVDRETRTMPVELDVDNASRELAPGMYAQVTWPLSSGGEILFLPPSAVKSTTERTFVVRVRNGKAEWVNVKRGVLDGDLVEVMGDLAAGDLVLKRGTDEIRPGTAVRAR
ncbi:MAG: efflux RND transporter periplasmic adaptor subunit [Bryobacterales bacterium]|nr:efflux RND transporter periplasmic adaptor subunit [Bryobacterales bacterium]